MSRVAVIPCSASKHPHGQTPLTLYRGGVFSTLYRHASLRCDEVVIMSAKYGLLNPQEQVSWYDSYIGALTETEREQLKERIRDQTHLDSATTLVSYLPAAYFQVLTSAKPNLSFRRPYRHLRLLTLIKVLSNELKNPTGPARR